MLYRALLLVCSAGCSTISAADSDFNLTLSPYAEYGLTHFHIKGRPAPRNPPNPPVEPRSEKADSYALGATLQIAKGLGIDAGFVDLGHIATGIEPVIKLDPLSPYTGADIWARGHYLLPRFEAQWGRRFGISLAVGPMLVTQRKVSVSYLYIAPKVHPVTEEVTDTTWLAKVTAYWRFTDRWKIQASAATSRLHIANYNEYFSPTAEVRLASVHLGFSYDGSWRLNPSNETPWEVCLGPTYSRIRYHATFAGESLGYDLMLRRRLWDGFFVGVGHTEYGKSRDTPTYPDGRPLRTPPYGRTDANRDLRIDSSNTYFAIGYSLLIGSRWELEAAAGPARTFSTLFGHSPAGAFISHYTESISKMTWLGRLHVGWLPSPGIRISAGLGYTEFSAPQIIHPGVEPVFGNTIVRIWSVMPQVSMRF